MQSPGLYNVEAGVIVSAVCNGRQAGVGQKLAPNNAIINDGLIDMVALHSFPKEALGTVVAELMDPESNGTCVKHYRVPWVEWSSEEVMPINLDDEPIAEKKVRFRRCQENSSWSCQVSAQCSQLRKCH